MGGTDENVAGHIMGVGEAFFPEKTEKNHFRVYPEVSYNDLTPRGLRVDRGYKRNRWYRDCGW